MEHLKSIYQAVLENSTSLNQVKDLEPLIKQIENCKVVMLGEATHGTHEFYHWRRLISEWLITKHGFNFIAVEGDWPACQTLNQYIHAQPHSREDLIPDARTALTQFKRWPTWMWANTDLIRLGEWMRSHNAQVSYESQIGFHGLDVYSLFESIDEVIQKLEKINPFLARRARHQYACFDSFNRDERKYARSLLKFPEGCEAQVTSVLSDLLNLRLNGFHDRELALFDAQQNARIIKSAENYYRTLIHGDEDSWNVRDRHMMETLSLLMEYYTRTSGKPAKGIVWAHNTHIGDYRATDMTEYNQINLGGVAREYYGEDNVALVGFSTYQGHVVASPSWDGPIQTMEVPPGKPGSYEEIFHQVALKNNCGSYFLQMTPHLKEGPLEMYRGHRAIGVVYDPKREQVGNYVPTSLSHRYDAMIFLDHTTPLEPLIQGFERKDIPETWPMGQ